MDELPAGGGRPRMERRRRLAAADGNVNIAAGGVPVG